MSIRFPNDNTTRSALGKVILAVVLAAVRWRRYPPRMPRKRPITIEPAARKPGRGIFNGNSCAVCSLPITVLKCVDEMFARGEQITAVRDWARKNFPAETSSISYMQFRGHKLNHVDQKIRAVRKLSDAEKQRKAENRLTKAILNDEIDPSSYFGAASIASDVKRASDRLEVAADAALDDGLFPALAALSGVLVRTTELRAKMGGNIAEAPALNLVLNINQLHEKLDGILSGDHADRQNAAKALLGISVQAGPTISQSWSGSTIEGDLEDDDATILEGQRVDPQPR